VFDSSPGHRRPHPHDSGVIAWRGHERGEPSSNDQVDWAVGLPRRDLDVVDGVAQELVGRAGVVSRQPAL
jgi:hypothetical protein